MSRRLALWALCLYPLAFRRRYGEEMAMLIEQTPQRSLAVLDVVRGALTAHVRPPSALSGVLDPGDRVRASASGQLACWIVFAAAGFGFYKTTEEASFASAGDAHPLLGAAHLTVEALAITASAAVLIGALPLILAALVRARREPPLRRIVSLPPLAVALFACLTGALAAFARSSHPGTLGGAAFIAWGIVGLACAGVCVIAARAVLFAVPLTRRRLLVAFACGVLVTAAMVGITLATALYAIALSLDASHLTGEPNGPLQAISTGASLTVQLLVMVFAAALASMSTRRGWEAARGRELGSASN